MLFTPEAVGKRRVDIARECQAGKISELEAGEQLVEADPDFGGGHFLEGNGRRAAGDLDGSESCYWKALDRMPCDHEPYMALSDVRRMRDIEDQLARRFMELAFWKLGLSCEIPDEVAEMFRERLKGGDIDFNSPISYEALAIALEEGREPAPSVRDRLLPYELLNELQRQSAEGLNPALLSEILQHAGGLTPLWRAALREWAGGRSALPSDTLGLMIALLGETGGPEVIDELLELIDFGDGTVALHANWAAWRIGQRFPAETLAKIRAATAGAPLTLRCALADQIDLLPEIPGMEEALIDLLEGFAGFAREDNASYLLVCVVHALEELDRASEAERILQEFQGLLSPAEREWSRSQLQEGFLSELVNEGIDEFTIEEICSDRILMEDEEAEDAEEDEYEDDLIEPVVAPVRPGRNEPCWCGSGKKYKKCHLAADEKTDH